MHIFLPTKLRKTQLERKKEMRKIRRENYIVIYWKGRENCKESASNRREVREIKKRLEKTQGVEYSHTYRVPFREKHPEFPIWFSLCSLFLVEVAPEVDSCIRHILRIMQQWI